MPGSQQHKTAKNLTEQDRRQTGSHFFRKIAETLAARMSGETEKTNKTQILNQTFEEINKIRKASHRSDDLQAAELSSSTSNIYSDTLFSPWLLEAIDGFLFCVDQDFKIEYITNNVSSFLGYNEDELRGKAISHIIHSGDLAKFNSRILLISVYGNKSGSSGTASTSVSNSCGNGGSDISSSSSDFSPPCTDDISQNMFIGGLKSLGAPSISGSGNNKSCTFNARFLVKPKSSKTEVNEENPDDKDLPLHSENDFVLSSLPENSSSKKSKRDDSGASTSDTVSGGPLYNLCNVNPDILNEPKYENLQVSVTLLPSPNSERQSGSFSGTDFVLFCMARRIPGKEEPPPETKENVIEVFSTKLDFTGLITAIDTSGVSATYSQYLNKDLIHKNILELCEESAVPALTAHLHSVIKGKEVGTNELPRYKLRVTKDKYLNVRTKSKRWKTDKMDYISAVHSIIPSTDENVTLMDFKPQPQPLPQLQPSPQQLQSHPQSPSGQSTQSSSSRQPSPAPGSVPIQLHIPSPEPNVAITASVSAETVSATTTPSPTTGTVAAPVASQGAGAASATSQMIQSPPGLASTQKLRNLLTHGIEADSTGNLDVNQATAGNNNLLRELLAQEEEEGSVSGSFNRPSSGSTTKPAPVVIQPAPLAIQNPMLTSMLAQTPKALPTAPISIPTSIVSQVPQERLPKNLEKKLIHTPANQMIRIPQPQVLQLPPQPISKWDSRDNRVTTHQTHVNVQPGLQQITIGGKPSASGQMRVSLTGSRLQQVQSQQPQQQAIQPQLQQLHPSTSQQNLPQVSPHSSNLQSHVVFIDSISSTTATTPASSAGPNVTGISSVNLASSSLVAAAPSDPQDSLLSDILDQVWSMQQEMNIESTTQNTITATAHSTTDDSMILDILDEVLDPHPISSTSSSSIASSSTNSSSGNSNNSNSNININHHHHHHSNSNTNTNASNNNVNVNSNNGSSNSNVAVPTSSLSLPSVSGVLSGSGLLASPSASGSTGEVGSGAASTSTVSSVSGSVSSPPDMNEIKAISEIQRQLMSCESSPSQATSNHPSTPTSGPVGIRPGVYGHQTGSSLPQHLPQLHSQQHLSSQQQQQQPNFSSNPPYQSPLCPPPPAYGVTSVPIVSSGSMVHGLPSSGPVPPHQQLQHHQQQMMLQQQGVRGAPGMRRLPGLPHPNGNIQNFPAQLIQHRASSENITQQQPPAPNVPPGVVGPPVQIQPWGKGSVDTKKQRLLVQQEKKRLLAQQTQQEYTLQTPENRTVLADNVEMPPNVALQIKSRMGNAPLTPMTPEAVGQLSPRYPILSPEIGVSVVGSSSVVGPSPLSSGSVTTSLQSSFTSPSTVGPSTTTTYGPSSGSHRMSPHPYNTSIPSPRGRGPNSPATHLQLASPQPSSTSSPVNAPHGWPPPPAEIPIATVGPNIRALGPIPGPVSSPVTVPGTGSGVSANRIQQQNPMLNAQLSQGTYQTATAQPNVRFNPQPPPPQSGQIMCNTNNNNNNRGPIGNSPSPLHSASRNSPIPQYPSSPGLYQSDRQTPVSSVGPSSSTIPGQPRMMNQQAQQQSLRSHQQQQPNNRPQLIASRVNSPGFMPRAGSAGSNVVVNVGSSVGVVSSGDEGNISGSVGSPYNYPQPSTPLDSHNPSSVTPNQFIFDNRSVSGAQQPSTSSTSDYVKQGIRALVGARTQHQAQQQQAQVQQQQQSQPSSISQTPHPVQLHSQLPQHPSAPPQQQAQSQQHLHQSSSSSSSSSQTPTSNMVCVSSSDNSLTAADLEALGISFDFTDTTGVVSSGTSVTSNCGPGGSGSPIFSVFHENSSQVSSPLTSSSSTTTTTAAQGSISFGSSDNNNGSDQKRSLLQELLSLPP